VEAALRESAVAVGYLKARCLATTPLAERLLTAGLFLQVCFLLAMMAIADNRCCEAPSIKDSSIASDAAG